MVTGGIFAKGVTVGGKETSLEGGSGVLIVDCSCDGVGCNGWPGLKLIC